MEVRLYRELLEYEELERKQKDVEAREEQKLLDQLSIRWNVALFPRRVHYPVRRRGSYDA
jgi:hypothetical protein